MGLIESNKKGNLQDNLDPKRGAVVSRTSKGEVKSCTYDDLWDFTGEMKTAKNKKAILRFSLIPLAYKRGIQETMDKLRHSMLGDEYSYGKKNISISVLEIWRATLVHVAKILDSTDWSLLNKDENYRVFMNKLKAKGISQNKADRLNAIFRKMYDIDILNRTISVQPKTASGPIHQVNLKSKVEIALGNLKPREESIAIPSAMFQKMLIEAVALLEKYHPYRYAISDVMAEAYKIRDRIHANENISGNRAQLSMKPQYIEARIRTVIKHIKHNIPDFKIEFTGYVLGQIQSACMLIVLAFSGTRIGEATSFTIDSYKDKDLNEGQLTGILCGEITKSNEGVPIATAWVSHSIVKDALELVHYMNAFARERYQSIIEQQYVSGIIDEDWRQKHWDETCSAFISCRVGVMTNKEYVGNYASTGWEKIHRWVKSCGIKATKVDVEEFNKLNPSRIGQLKEGSFLSKLSPHDFRRSFAVFFIRQGFGTLTGIKFQYKHTNINMSGYYASNAALAAMDDLLIDEELMNILDEARVEWGVDTYDEIFNHSEQLSGGAGERIFKDKYEKMKNGQQVFMTRAEIKKLVMNSSISLVQLPSGGYCTNASCDRVCAMFAAEKQRCKHKIIDDNSAKQMAKNRLRLIKKFRGLNNGDRLQDSILVGLKQRIQLIEKTLEKHNINYDKFTDNLMGIVI